MGYNINFDSTCNVAHRDDIQEYVGRYYTCRPSQDWEHIETIQETNLAGIYQVVINGQVRQFKLCGNCQPHP